MNQQELQRLVTDRCNAWIKRNGIADWWPYHFRDRSDAKTADHIASQIGKHLLESKRSYVIKHGYGVNTGVDIVIAIQMKECPELDQYEAEFVFEFIANQSNVKVNNQGVVVGDGFVMGGNIQPPTIVTCAEGTICGFITVDELRGAFSMATMAQIEAEVTARLSMRAGIENPKWTIKDNLASE